MIYVAVFLLSLSALSFEILLVRVFSISQWNHLSFMVISIALFGFAASGTYFNFARRRRRPENKPPGKAARLKVLSILYSSSAVLSVWATGRIPFDYFRIPFEPVQLVYLFAIYVLLSFPFFFAGLVIMIGYADKPEKSGRIYFANMLGSSLGTLLPILILPLVGEVTILVSVSLIPLSIVFLDMLQCVKPASADPRLLGGVRKDPVLIGICLGVILLSAYLFRPTDKVPGWIEPSPYKALSQFFKYPETRLAQSSSSITGRIDLITSPFLRYAPGLSLTHHEPISVQKAAFKDGDHPFFLFTPDQNSLVFAKRLLQYAGYHTALQVDRVLVIQNGGGSALACAMASGSKDITIVEQNRHLAEIISSHYSHDVLNASPRSFLAGSNEPFDVVHIENWGPSLSGAAALSQEYLLTIDAFAAYLRNLRENGVLIVSRRLHLPPADSVRICATAYAGLKEIGVTQPRDHIIVLRNWDTFTLLLSRTPIKRLERLKDFIETNNFDVVYAGGRLDEFINQYNQFDRPYHASAITDLFEAYEKGAEKLFLNRYLLDARPQSDARPYPNHFFKFSTITEAFRATGSRFFSLLVSGEVVVWAVFVEAAIISLILFSLSVWPFLKNRHRLEGKPQLFFLGIGAGFMFMEMYFIQSYTLLFADPVISFSVVLACILVFSSAGGIFSQRIRGQGIQKALLLLAGLMLAFALILDPILHKILALPKITRSVTGILFLIPVGFLSGIPFPMGMRHLLSSESQRGFAWTVNGCASVLAAVFSAHIALTIGIDAILVISIACYLMAFIFISIHRQPC